MKSLLLSEIFSYNDYNRDMFIAGVAKLLPKGTRVLDAGAGTCKYKPLFSHCEYKSQDFAKYEGPEHVYGKLDYVCDVTSIPEQDRSFDAIICTEVFEHIPRPDLALKEFARILKSDGILVITAPLGSGIHMPPYHYYGGFTPHWFEHFLSGNGFSLKSCVPNGGFFKLYAQESQRFLYMITPRHKAMRVAFFPAKLILALWFKVVIPIGCHLLDQFDKTQEFTAGYFVTARKI